MATDGVKIIDSDTAHDVYNGIYTLYNNGATHEEMMEAFPFGWTVEGDGFEHEQYITAWALAMWETGGLTPDHLTEVQRVVALGNGVRVWTEEVDAKAGAARQKELDKLLKKISVPPTRIKKRQLPPKTPPQYPAGTLLAFPGTDGQWGLAIVTNVVWHSRRYQYTLALTNWQGTQPPDVATLAPLQLWGYKIPVGGSFEIPNHLEQLIADGTMNELWALQTEEYVPGLCTTGASAATIKEMTGWWVVAGQTDATHLAGCIGSRSVFANANGFLQYVAQTTTGTADAQPYPIESFSWEFALKNQGR
jgi:hypothetical protein